MKWYITGDTHGKFLKFNLIELEPGSKVIILGDAGLNYYLDLRDELTKEKLRYYYADFYCVRGNHEQRPEAIKDMNKVYDEEVKGYIYMEDKYPYIKYFIDGNEYDINGQRTLVLGGAYSVDKWYRIDRGMSWFAEEQLSQEEREEILAKVKGNHYDLILAHTCPICWQPRDLFLSFLDQSKIDNSMEKWLYNLMQKITWSRFFFGHYHDDRIVRPGVYMLYDQVHELDNINTNILYIDPKYNQEDDLLDNRKCSNNG